MSTSIPTRQSTPPGEVAGQNFVLGRRGMGEPLQMSPPRSCSAEIGEPLQEPPVVAPPDPVLPPVVIPGGAISISKSARQLYGIIAPTKRLFIKDRKVTLLTPDDNGKMIFEEVSPCAACSLFGDFVQFVTPKKGIPSGYLPVYDPTIIKRDMADLYLQCTERNQLPVIRGIVNCPIITEHNGSVRIVEGGYDEKTGTFVNSYDELPEVTLEDAVELLPLLIDEFDFQTPGDKSRALAEMLSPALKFGGFFKDPVPVFVAEADKSQSGKSYRQGMTAALYNEILDTTSQKESTVGSLEESLATALTEGRPFIQVDNVRGKISSTFIEAFTTARGTMRARPAYSKDLKVDPSRHIIMINSNGFQATKDLVNRAVIVRIKKREGYEYRDMLRFILDHQPYLLSLVFAIVREWHRRGKPRTSERGHDFREWSQTMDWIVQNIFNCAPLLEGHAEAQNIAASPGHSFLLKFCQLVQQSGMTGYAYTAQEIGNLCHGRDIAIPLLAPDKRDNEESRKMAVGKVMAELFKENPNEVTVENFVITREIQKVVRDAGKEFDQKTYTVRLAN